MSDSSESDDCIVLPDPNPGISEFAIGPPVAKEEMKDAEKEVEDNHSDNQSDTETISTIDLCPKKKVSVSMSTYVHRPDNSLKKQLEKLNSSSMEGVSSKLSRESKRRKVEVKFY